MSEPGTPVTPLMEMMLRLERRASMLTGVLVGICATLLLLAIVFFAVGARAQEVPRAALEMRRDIIREGRATWGLEAPTATFAAQIHQESAYRADARSAVGAVGLAQFMPSTSAWIRTVYPSQLGDGDPLNPRWALRALVLYDRYLWERVEAFTACDRMGFTLAAYNGGLGHVINRKRLSLYPLQCFGATCDVRPPGVSEASQRENSGYPRRILLTLEPVYVRAGFGPGACTS